MTISTHTAIGAIIGLSIGNPLLGFVAGFASHLLLDMVPHGDTGISKNLRVYKKKKGAFAYGTIDSIIAIYIALIFTQTPGITSEITLCFAIMGSILPDLLVGLYDITKSKFLKPLYDLHFFFHDFFVKTHGDIKLPTALIGQVVIILIIILQI